MVVVGLSQLGNPSTLSAGRISSSPFDFDDGLGERLGGGLDIVSMIDGVFTVSGALRFLVLQLVLVKCILIGNGKNYFFSRIPPSLFSGP